MENSAQFFYEKLRTTTNPGLLLAQFYGEQTSKVIGRSEVIACNRLIKTFGRFSLFFAILDVTRNPEEIYGNDIYPLLYAVCKNRFEREFHDTSSVSSEDLSKTLKTIEKAIEQTKKEKVIFPDSSKLGDINGG